MRTRERERVERHARAALARLSPRLAARLRVVWCRRLPTASDEHVHAVALAADTWICVDEHVFAASGADAREDTIRHEIAHLIAWERHGHEIAHHGPEFARARRDLDRELDASDEA